MLFLGKAREFLQLDTLCERSCRELQRKEEGALTILWFLKGSSRLEIDGKEVEFNPNQVVFLTEFHHVVPLQLGQVQLLRFNRSFYCILESDSEVGCKGILFFGAAQLPIIQIPESELEMFRAIWDFFLHEMKSRDNLQVAMLQLMLKRVIILCTRLFKAQHKYPALAQESDLIRAFNFLVEQHFREYHKVAEYAELLYKSPKTLSNVFSKVGTKTPMQFIQDRIMLEARRLLLYSDKPVKEIAYDLGFESNQAFSRFFKTNEGISPGRFRKNVPAVEGASRG